MILILLFIALFVFLFFREDTIEYKRRLKKHHEANAHVLKEIERFLEEKEKRMQRNLE